MLQDEKERAEAIARESRQRRRDANRKQARQLTEGVRALRDSTLGMRQFCSESMSAMMALCSSQLCQLLARVALLSIDTQPSCGKAELQPANDSLQSLSSARYGQQKKALQNELEREKGERVRGEKLNAVETTTGRRGKPKEHERNRLVKEKMQVPIHPPAIPVLRI